MPSQPGVVWTSGNDPQVRQLFDQISLLLEQNETVTMTMVQDKATLSSWASMDLG
jgi:hypothetical protein